MIRRTLFVAAAVAVFCPMSFESVSAQAPYPSRPVKILVASPPGGPAEFIMRLVAERLSSVLGKPVIIENRPGGAGGSIAAKIVSGSDPDGHTLLWSYPGPLTTAPTIYRNVGYDPAKDLAPVAAIFSSPQVLMVNATVPAKTVKEFVAYLKANPGKFSYSSAGLGTQPHLLAELFKSVAGVDLLHVPYRGGGLALQALLAGQVQMQFETTTSILPHIEAGTLRALAVADKSRNPRLPDVPTTIESGFPALQGTFWTGVVAPARTPADIVNRLNTEINAILKSKEVADGLAKLSATPTIGTPQEFAAFIAQETRRWAAVIEAANIAAN